MFTVYTIQLIIELIILKINFWNRDKIDLSDWQKIIIGIKL